MFRAPFLAPSSYYRGEQCVPEEGCSVAQVDAEFHCCYGQRKTTIRPEPPVGRSVTTAPSVSTPAASSLAHRHRTSKVEQDGDDNDDDGVETSA